QHEELDGPGYSQRPRHEACGHRVVRLEEVRDDLGELTGGHLGGLAESLQVRSGEIIHLRCAAPQGAWLLALVFKKMVDEFGMRSRVCIAEDVAQRGFKLFRVDDLSKRRWLGHIVDARLTHEGNVAIKTTVPGWVEVHVRVDVAGVGCGAGEKPSPVEIRYRAFQDADGSGVTERIGIELIS